MHSPTSRTNPVTAALVAAAVLALGTSPAARASADAPDPPRYAVGSIPDQRVWFNEEDDGLTFDVVADGLGDSPTITASYDESNAPDGELTFDTELDRFHFAPAPTDTTPVDITFLAVGSGPAVVQTVRIEPVQPLPPETRAFGIDPDPSTLPDPESRDYLVIEDTPNGDSIPFNEQLATETRSVRIVGKRVVFENGHPNGLYEDLHAESQANANVRELEIHADTLVVRDAVRFPQTAVTIRAIDVVFEDQDGRAPASISTKPLVPFGGSAPERVDGTDQPKPEGGLTGGSIDLRAENLDAPGDTVRFITCGGTGRDARPGRTVQTSAGA